MGEDGEVDGGAGGGAVGRCAKNPPFRNRGLVREEYWNLTKYGERILERGAGLGLEYRKRCWNIGKRVLESSNMELEYMKRVQGKKGIELEKN